MEGENTCPSQAETEPGEQPGTVELPDEIVRKQQAFRRYLQDAAGPGFNDPTRAAELAGFLPAQRSRASSVQTAKPLFFRYTMRRGIQDAAKRRIATAEKIQRRIAEGMDASKIVVVYDSKGVRRSVEVADQAQRYRWAQLALRHENLLPARGEVTDDMSEFDAVKKAAEAESHLDPAIDNALAKLSRTDRLALAQFYIQLDWHQQRLQALVIERKLGKSIEEFEGEVQLETAAEMKRAMSRISSHLKDSRKGETGAHHD